MRWPESDVGVILRMYGLDGCDCAIVANASGGAAGMVICEIET